MVWYHPPTSHASERVCHSGAACVAGRHALAVMMLAAALLVAVLAQAATAAANGDVDANIKAVGDDIRVRKDRNANSMDWPAL